MAPTEPGEAPPSASRVGRTKTKSVHCLLLRRHHCLLLKGEENLWNEGLDWNAGIHVDTKPEEKEDMDSDPDIMNDADEL
ncbi:unnamed protein product [Urochloa humidicola]